MTHAPPLAWATKAPADDTVAPRPPTSSAWHDATVVTPFSPQETPPPPRMRKPSETILRLLRAMPSPAPARRPPTMGALGRMRSSLDVSHASVVAALMQHPLKDTIAVDVRGALDPQSTFLKIWHQVLLAAIFYDFFLVPFIVTFKPHASVTTSPEILAFYFCELLFLGDFGVKLNTGFYEDGSVHRDTRRSMLKYVKSLGFVLDILAIVPLSLLEKPNSTSNMYLEIHKVLRLQRIPAYLNNLDDFYAKHFEALKIFKTVVCTLLLSHYIACIRFTFGYDDDHTSHWLAKRLVHGENEHLSTQTQYLQSLFWGFGMLTGFFEGELPHAIGEFLFTIAVALCGFSVFTYLCGLFFMLSKCESGKTEEAEARINQLKHIMAFHEVPERLQARTTDYLKRFSTDGDSNDRDALKLLCPSIAKDLQVELLRDTVARIPVFAGCSSEFIRALTNALEVMFLPAHCTVFHVNDQGDGMYIIHAGVLDVVIGNAKVRELRKGDFVGEMSLFSNRTRSATVVTTTYSILYKLSRFHTERVLEGYPNFVEVVRQSVMEIIAKTEQKNSPEAAKPGEELQGDRIQKDRRLSAFASQLTRMFSGGTVSSASARKKSSVAPEGGESRPARPPKVIARRPEALRAKLHRAITGRHLADTSNVGIFHDQYTRHEVRVETARTGWSRLLLKKSFDADSDMRLWWIILLQLVLVYDWILTPLEFGFPAIDLRVWFITVLSVIMDVILFMDIYLNFNLSYNINSEKIVDTSRTAVRYLRSHFAIDFILVFPYWMFQSLVPIQWALRVPRLMRIWRLRGHMHEIEKLHPLNSKQINMLLGGSLLVMCHIVACLYFSTTALEGFNPGYDSWIPTDDVELRPTDDGLSFLTADNRILAGGSTEVQAIAAEQYFRAFFYATNVLTGLGKTVEPKTDTQFVIAVMFMYTGFIITAVVVDNVQKRFTASAFEQKEFFVVRSRIQLFLRRQNAPLPIHHRVNSFLDYWWSAHRGARVEDLLSELPIAYRREILRSICSPALQTLALMNNVRPVVSRLETAFVDCVSFVLYGQGEYVYHEGDNAHWTYFSLHGVVGLQRGGSLIKKVPLGGFFGVQAVQGEDGTAVYSEDAVAASGCILIRLSGADVTLLREVFDDLPTALLQLERRMLDNKLARFTSEAMSRASNELPTSRLRSLLLDPIDPDSPTAVAWETWLFCAMTIQWIVTLYHISFGVRPDHFAVVDGLNVFLEFSFFVDVYVRSRVGYHEFGNKIMDLRRIRRRYFQSQAFAIDLCALIPVFTVNWMMKSARYELLNINKLVRLLKVPKQFARLEQRYLKRTTELRIIKLAYYAFLATHLSGCVYHDFASHLSTANLKDPNLSERKTAFGWNLWLLESKLKDEGDGLQYFSALFWTFGLMSASYQGELPKTVPQCIFSVLTMMSGFFLFAYVIGNFSDVIEMVDDENREFNARIGSVRHLLSHFTLPDALSTKLKRFFFFRRYHTITQEHFIESVLPPSLVTDIRLLNLQPMIAKVPFMGGMEPAITRMLVAQFSQVLVLKGDYVYRFGDDGTDMFFVFTGMLAVMNSQGSRKLDARTPRMRGASVSGVQSAQSDPNFKNLRETSQLVSGDFFGENALFSDSPRNAYVLAKTSCILYSLSRQSLNIVFELFPKWKKQVTQTVKVQQKQHRLRGVTNAQIREGNSTGSAREDPAESESDTGIMVSARSLRSRRPVEVLTRRNRLKKRLLLFLTRGTLAQSRTHIQWLWLVVFSTVFNAVMAPYRISVDALERWTGMCILVRLLDILTDIMFVLDIWFNWHLQESPLSVELYEQNLRERYKKERLVWDVVSTVPIDYVLSLLNIEAAMWFRLLRCVKVVNLVPYLNEINRLSASYELARLGTIWLQCLIYLFWVACAYLSLGVFGGFAHDWNAWAPSHELEYDDHKNPNSHQVLLRFLRGMFYATTAFAKKAKTLYPETTGHLVFSIFMSFVGTLVMAFMIGEMASLYISYIRNQVEFRKNHITLELFLSRYKASRSIRDRVHIYLSTLWSSHSGVDYESVLAQLPADMRVETVKHIAGSPLDALIEIVFDPLLRGDSHATEDLVRSLASELKFAGYPRGEFVISEGVLSSSMFFVVRGHLIMTSTQPIPPTTATRFRKGDYFGEKGIMSLAVSRFSVRTLKACDLFSLSCEGMKRVLRSHAFFDFAFEVGSEVVSELQTISDHPTNLPTNMETWRTVLRKTLEAQRQKWVVSSGANPGSPPPRMSRALTLWCTLIVDILDGDKKDSGLTTFAPFLQLLTMNGTIFERPRVTEENRKSRILRMGSGNNRARFRDMVMKISRGEPRSARSTKSSRSARIQSTREGNDRVEPFVPESALSNDHRGVKVK